jgi:hypothetical protein
MDQVVQAQTSDFLTVHPDNSLSFQINDIKDLQNITSSNGDVIAPNQALTGVDPRKQSGRILPMQISMAGNNSAITNLSANFGLDLSAPSLKRITFTMLIAPEVWNQGKVNSFQHEYTRKGWVIQLWGPNQDTISSTGKTAAFMTSGQGTDYYTRYRSLSFLNFLATIDAYRNNGYTFLDPLATTSLSRVISTVHGVEISYDNNIMLGHFNNFTIDEDEEHPYLFNYNFEFIAGVLCGTHSEVRGHYVPIPASTEAQGPGQGPVLVDNVYPISVSGTTSSPSYQFPTDNNTVQRLWALKTGGAPYSVAVNSGFTDGSIEGNASLMSILIDPSTTWDPNTGSFQ